MPDPQEAMTEGRISLDVDQVDSLFLTPVHLIPRETSLPNEHFKRPTDTDTNTDTDTSFLPALLDAVEDLAVKDSAPSKQEYPLTINESVTSITTTPQSDRVQDPDDSLSLASITADEEADRSHLTSEICEDNEERLDEEELEELEELELELEELDEEELEEEELEEEELKEEEGEDEEGEDEEGEDEEGEEEEGEEEGELGLEGEEEKLEGEGEMEEELEEELECEDENDGKEEEGEKEEDMEGVDKEIKKHPHIALLFGEPEPRDSRNASGQESQTADCHGHYLEQNEERECQQFTQPALKTPPSQPTPAVSSTHCHSYTDDDEDEGERGTIVILTRSQHRGFRRNSIDSKSTVSSIASAPCDPGNSQGTEDHFTPCSEEVSTHAVSTPNSSCGSNSRNSIGAHQMEFILQPSGLESHLNIITALSEPHSPTSSSVSSSGNSTPVVQAQRPRPFSQQPLPVSFLQTPPITTECDHSVDEDEFQVRPIRRSRSMPSSPKSFSSFEVVSLSAFDSPRPSTSRFSAFDSPRPSTNRSSEYISAPKLEQELSCDWLPSQHSPTCPLHYGPHKEGEIITREILRDDSESMLPAPVRPRPPQLSTVLGLGERPRRQSLLSPRQLQRLSQQKDGFQPRPKEITGPLWKTRLGYLGKDHHKKIDKKGKGSSAQEYGIGSKGLDSTHSSAQKLSRSSGPSVPFIAFQLHKTEISTERPSVSGRLILHVPRRAGKKFHFVSLALHLRLKESIAWTRHDLFSFEVENHHWAQTVWDKKMDIPFQDRQVEEGVTNAFGSRMAKGISPAAAIAAAALAPHSEAKPTMPTTSAIHQNTVGTPDPSHRQPATLQSESSALEDAQGYRGRDLTDIERPLTETHSPINKPVLQAMTMDEWRWEWLLPVSRSEVRPESFEGSMGMVWYELEAKCLFRWDDVDKDGNVIPNHSATMTANVSSSFAGPQDSSNAHSGMAKGSSGSRKLLKGFGASTRKAKSIAQVFGKLRVGSKPKSTTGVGDFKVPSLHEQYIQNSIRKTQEAAEAAAAAEAAKVANEGLGQRNDGSQEDRVHGSDHHYKQQDDAGGSGTSSGTSSRDADEIPAGANVPSRTFKASTPLPLIPEPVPFLVRRILKLYFSNPPVKTSSNPAFFLPQPLMSLPTLPSTRRLKAIIPGAKIQVQIQVPSIIPIPGYAQTSQLMPNAKTGGLGHAKGSGNLSTTTTSGGIFGDKFTSDHSRRNSKDHHHPQDDRYPRNFQAALTIRKVTQQDINKNESLRRRYEFAESAAAPTGRFPVGPDTSTASHPATSGSSPHGSSRSRTLSHQPEVHGASLTRSAIEEHCLDDAEEFVTAYPCPDDRTGDQDKRQGSSGATDPLKPMLNKGWRKEIRVRKVKCEFWQKESCRIPTDDAPSRSIKVQLSPVFSYSEKDHEKERQRQTSQHHSSVSLEPMVPHLSDDVYLQPPHQSKYTASAAHEGGSSGPRSSFLNAGRRSSIHTFCQPFLEPAKAWTGRKSSTGSIFPSGLQPPLPFSSPIHHPASGMQTQSSRPFMLLVPIPLDNPRLRQTFSWPSTESPSPIVPSAYDYPFPGAAGTESGIGFGSELDYLSQPTQYEMMGATSRGPIATTYPSGPPVKARIEVKHYLTFRLSLDMLEYEGETEKDDVDLEAIEEQQLQEARSYQDLSLTSDRPFHSGTSQLNPPVALPILAMPPHYHGGQRTPSSPDSPTSVDGSLSAGLEAESGIAPVPELFGMVYERRGSKESSGTVRSTVSGNSTNNPGAGGGETLSSIAQTQASSGLSGGSNVSDRLSTPQTSSGGHNKGSGGLVAGAIGAIKKKASATRLGNIVNSSSSISTHSQHQPVSTVTTQRLKDFVIRVPITIVIQIDDRGKVTNAFGTVDNSDPNSTVPIGSRMNESSGQQNDRNTSSPSTAPFNGPGNITTTATTTIKNIVTGCSGEPRHSIDPLESTDTFGSLASMAASAGSEPLRRRMDDFATGSSSLAFAGLKRRQDQSGLAAAQYHHRPPLQRQQQEQEHHVVPSLLPLTSEGLQQHLRDTYQQEN